MNSQTPAKRSAGRGWRCALLGARRLLLRLVLALVGTVTPLAVLAGGG